MSTCAHVYVTTGDSQLSCNLPGEVPDGGGPPLCRDHLAAAPTRGYVYVAEWGDYVKVGYSANPEARVSVICRGSDSTIAPPTPQAGRPVLVGYAPGDLQTEAMLHAVLDDARAIGEWFTRSAAVERLLQRVLGVGSPPPRPVRGRPAPSTEPDF